MKRTFVTVSNAEFYDVLREDSDEGETNWTVSRHARRGDRVLLYICAPISAIVAVATISTDVELNDDPSSEWFGHYMADMHSLRMLAEPITRAALIEWLPSWGYWKQPRNSLQVPEQFLPILEEVLRAAEGKSRERKQGH
jgi:hypothetical protein